MMRGNGLYDTYMIISSTSHRCKIDQNYSNRNFKTHLLSSKIELVCNPYENWAPHQISIRSKQKSCHLSY